MEPGKIATSPLHILMASGVPRRRKGGVAAIICNLGREIERRGHRVSYLFQEDLIDPGSSLRRFDETNFSLRLARHIAKNRGKFSIVNLHAPVGFVYGMLRRWNRGREYPPYVMTLHGLEERRIHVMSREEKKGRALHFSWKNRLWHRCYIQPRFNWSIRTADGAHAYSRDVWNILQLKYNLDSDRAAYIANGVEERFFSPRDYRQDGRMRLLYAGTWLDQRGIFYLRDALWELTAKIPDLTMTFAGCGVPEQEITGFFGPELAGKVLVRPVVAADRMQELYAEHDVLLFPSLMEGLPSVLLEAMATGMPVITTETCGMPDVVEHEHNGMLIAPADAKAIGNAVIRLAESAELRERLGRTARETMRRYTWERSASQLEALYFRVLEKEAQAAG
jgi:glycosyltransferase involved in cell wall biosynthesis